MKEAAAAIATVFDGDKIFRIGGDEFLVIADKTSKEAYYSVHQDL